MSTGEIFAMLIAIAFTAGLLIYHPRAVKRRSCRFGLRSVGPQDWLLDDNFLSALKPDFDARPDREQDARRRKRELDDADHRLYDVLDEDVTSRDERP